MYQPKTLWLNAGQYIIREGEVRRDIFVLLSGELVVEIAGRKIAAVTATGDVVGELAALSGMPRTASVYARVASEVLCIQDVTASALAKLPSVFEKIDASISRRYEIARNKIRMYTGIASTIKRSLLQEIMRRSAPHMKKIGALAEVESGKLRRQVRKRIDEISALYPDSDDPAALDRIAMEYGVSDLWRDKLSSKPWLDAELTSRLERIEGDWNLISTQRKTDVGAKAAITVRICDLLAIYDKMPGIKREMDLMRMESIVPSNSKVEALRMAHAQKFPDISERERLLAERKIKLAVERVKADAGNDLTLMINAARELGIEGEYEDQIRNIVGLTETATDFIDISSPALPND